MTITIDILIGQSNASGNGSGANFQSTNKIFSHWNTNWEDYDTTTNSSPAGGKYGVDKCLLQEYQNRNEEVWLIKSPINGSNLFDDWSASGSSWTNFVQTYNSAIQSLTNDFGFTTIIVNNVIWIQGESDVPTCNPNYLAEMSGLQSRLQNLIGSNFQFVTSAILSTADPTNCIRPQQIQFANNDPNVILFDLDDYSQDALDNLHLGTNGLCDLGKDISELNLSTQNTSNTMTNTSCNCCNNTFFLGCVNNQNLLSTYIAATIAGIYKLKVEFAGNLIEIDSLPMVIGQFIEFDISQLNENYTFTGVICDPQGNIVEFSRSSMNYGCIKFATRIGLCYSQPIYTFGAKITSLCDLISPMEEEEPKVVEELLPFTQHLDDGASIDFATLLANNPNAKGIASFDFDLKPINGDGANGFIATTSDATSSGQIGERNLDGGGSFSYPFIEYTNCTFRRLPNQTFTVAAGSAATLSIEFII